MPDFAVTELIAGLADVLGPAEGGVPLHEPQFKGREQELVADCIASGWVSSVGAYVDAFEQAVAQAAGARFAVATVNGTAALHTGMLLLGVRPGDEVILPSLTFVATANAVAYCQAIPHFADVEASTLGLDPDKLRRHLLRIAAPNAKGGVVNRESGHPIRAIVPMHVFGHPARINDLLAVAEEFGLALIEDAAEALGSQYRGRPVGATAPLGAFSFNGNKIVTSGGGGALVMNDEALRAQAKHLTTTAKIPHPWRFDHDRIGFNYRLPNLNAALGVAQMERLPAMLDAKRRLARAYFDRFEGLHGARMLREADDARSNYWLNALLLDIADPALRDDTLEALHAARYFARPIWTPMHRLPMFQQAPRDDLTVTENIEARLINLPSSARHGDLLPAGPKA